MDKTLNIKIKVDKDTGAVKVVGNDFDTLNTKTKQANVFIICIMFTQKKLTKNKQNKKQKNLIQTQ